MAKTYDTGSSELDEAAASTRKAILAGKKSIDGQDVPADAKARTMARRFDKEVDKIDKNLTGDDLKAALRKASQRANMYVQEMSFFEDNVKKAIDKANEDKKADW
jgi:hypothetical protein